MTTNPYESPETRSNPVPLHSDLPKLLVRVLVVVAILAVLVALLLPARRTGGREAGRRMQCSNHLKQIALALQNYADTYGFLPPAYTVDSEGTPLHSWRTLILPFIGEKALYDEIDLSRPWDDPANRAAYETNLSFYLCPSGKAVKCQTTYFAVVAPGGCFQPTEPTPLAAITDKTSETLMVVDVSEKYAVHWMSPHDATEELILQRQTAHPNGSMAVFVDGHTGFLSKNTPAEIIRALISISGNEKVGDY